MTRLLIVAPAFNEAATLPDYIRDIAQLRQTLRSRADVRLLVVDDGSEDDTAGVLRRTVAAQGDWIGFVLLTANAGHQAALLAGLCHAGDWPDAIVTMDSDREHPAVVVEQLLDAWTRTGAVVVHALRRPARALPWLKRVPSAFFYRVTSALTGLNLADGQADFRLWDASILREVQAYLPHVGSLRVFAAWLPGPKASVDYEQAVMGERTSRFTFRKNLELAISGIIRFSPVPLQAITALGAIGLVFSALYGTYIAVEKVRGETVPGWASTVLTVMAMGCLQLIALGVLASYFRRLVFAQDLPPWVVRSAQLPFAKADTQKPPSP